MCAGPAGECWLLSMQALAVSLITLVLRSRSCTRRRRSTRVLRVRTFWSPGRQVVGAWFVAAARSISLRPSQSAGMIGSPTSVWPPRAAWAVRARWSSRRHRERGAVGTCCARSGAEAQPDTRRGVGMRNDRASDAGIGLIGGCRAVRDPRASSCRRGRRAGVLAMAVPRCAGSTGDPGGARLPADAVADTPAPSEPKRPLPEPHRLDKRLYSAVGREGTGCYTLGMPSGAPLPGSEGNGWHLA